MPELAVPTNRGIQTPSFQPISPASYLSNTPVADTSRLSKAQGKAALYSNIAQVLADLPNMLVKSYDTGRKLKVGNDVQKDYEAARANPQTGALSNFSADSSGSIKFSPIDAEERRLRLAALNKGSTTLYDRVLANVGGAPNSAAPALPAPIPSTSPSAPVKPLAAVGSQGAPSLPLAGITSDVPEAPPISEPVGAPDSLGLPSADFVPVGKDASQKALANIGAPTTDIVEPPGGTSGSRTLDPVSGIITSKSPNGQVYELLPGSNTWNEVHTTATKKEEGVKFPSAEAAALAGYDPTGAKVNPDGSVTVTTFKASGTDAKGRAKITDNQKNALGSAAVLSKSIDGLMEKYDELSKEGKVGPVSGRIEQGKQAIGMGSEEGAKIQAEMNISLFKIARMLNGAGVLTDKDINRATAVAPTMTMGRGQFKGQLEAVKGTIRDGLETWLSTNAGQATDEQIALAKKAISSLDGSESKTATSPATEVKGKDAEAVEWLRSNPNDPMASKIRAALQARGVPL